MKKSMLLALFSFSIASKIFSQAGNLDSSFNGDGELFVRFAGSNETANAVAIQSNQRIIIAGSVYQSTTGGFGLARYLPKGRVDSSFGINGQAVTQIKSFSSLSAIALQQDEKIVAAGKASDTLSNVYAIARYKTNGTPDSSFGDNGIVTTDFAGSAACAARVVAIQHNGKIIVGGFVHYTNPQNDFINLIRYEEDGTIDSSFGVDGRVYFSIGNNINTFFSLALAKNGKILVGTSDDSKNTFILTRYQTNGVLDSSFGNDGVNKIYFSNKHFTTCYAMALQTDGKILMGGSSETGLFSTADFLLIRVKSDGHLDSAFGTNGIVNSAFEKSGIIFSIALQADGKILASGIVGDDNARNIAIIRYKRGGLVDYSYGNRGRVITNIDKYDDIGSTAIQQDGKLVVSASAHGHANQSKMVLLRYNGDSTSSFLNNNTIAQKQDAVISKPINISLSPNPVKDVLRIQGLSSSLNTISVIDNTGKTLKTAVTSNQTYSLNMQQLAAGIYFIKIGDGKKTSTLKFIKE